MSVVDYLFHSISSGQVFVIPLLCRSPLGTLIIQLPESFDGDGKATLCVGTVFDQIRFNQIKDLCIVMDD